jgi:hypothetical protein
MRKKVAGHFGTAEIEFSVLSQSGSADIKARRTFLRELASQMIHLADGKISKVEMPLGSMKITLEVVD